MKMDKIGLGLTVVLLIGSLIQMQWWEAIAWAFCAIAEVRLIKKGAMRLSA